MLENRPESEKKGAIKQFLFVNRKAPYGSIYALESLEVVLISAAFDQDVSLLFADDGVYQICKNQNPSSINMKNFSKAFAVLGDYGIRKIYVEKESLEIRGLALTDLLPLSYEDEDDDWAEKNAIQLVSQTELVDIMDQQDVILSF